MDNSKTTSYRWIILGIVSIAAALSCYAQFVVAARAFELIPALGLNMAAFAMIMSAPMFPNIFLGIPIGALADRFGVKSVVGIGLIIGVIGTTFRYMCYDFMSYFILMMLSGVGVMALNSNIGKIVGAWFEDKEVPTALGIYYAGCRAGMFLGMATGAMFPTAKASYVFVGILLAISTVLWYILAKNHPVGAPAAAPESVTKYIGQAARSKYVWVAGFACFFYWGGFMIFAGNLANALNVVSGISPVQAGWLSSMIFLGNTFGNLLAPIWAEKVGRMKPFMFACVVGSIGINFGWSASETMLWPILLITGFLLGGAIPFFMVYPVVLPEVSKEAHGSAGGIIDCLMLAGAFCIPSFIIAPISGNNFALMFGLATVCMVLVGVCTWILPELGRKGTYLKTTESKQAVSN
ncbi:nitrate/nitrite transporter [Desulfitobacterium sp. Sab5]|uniref:MFS transporter n=1 Tax=Desulfitobacterium nosdiversum TaxID=3375356 RepID=UPI003CED5D45